MSIENTARLTHSNDCQYFEKHYKAWVQEEKLSTLLYHQ